MAIVAGIKENWKEDKVILQNAISALKKSMTAHKAERKTEWRLFKVRFNEDLKNIEKTLKNLNTLNKK